MAVGILGVTTNQLLPARTLASLQGARTKEGFRQWACTIPVKAPTACGPWRAMLLNGWRIGSRKTLCAATCGIRKGRRVVQDRSQEAAAGTLRRRAWSLRRARAHAQL